MKPLINKLIYAQMLKNEQQREMRQRKTGQRIAKRNATADLQAGKCDNKTV